jgi:hypothetical protein
MTIHHRENTAHLRPWALGNRHLIGQSPAVERDSMAARISTVREGRRDPLSQPSSA